MYVYRCSVFLLDKSMFLMETDTSHPSFPDDGTKFCSPDQREAVCMCMHEGRVLSCKYKSPPALTVTGHFLCQLDANLFGLIQLNL